MPDQPTTRATVPLPTIPHSGLCDAPRGGLCTCAAELLRLVGDWIEWASPIWTDASEGGWIDGDHLAPVWWGIRETDVLNYRNAREVNDEKHIAPLQLGFIDRCVRLWSNPGELVLSPFMGIGSEGYQSIKRGRRFVGCELKASYWRQAVTHLRRAEAEVTAPSLFDTEPA